MNKVIPSVISLLALAAILAFALKDSIRPKEQLPPIKSSQPSQDAGIKSAKPSSKDVAQTSEAASTSKFGARIYTSLQNPNMQWWFNLPPNSTPHIAPIKKLFIGQTFSIFSFLDKAQIKDGKFSVTYSIEVVTPDNARETLLKPTLFEGEKKSKDVILACPDIITANATKDYKEGRYFFEISAKDNISGQEAKGSTYADFVKWSPPNPFVGEKLVYDYIRGFYLQPSAEHLYSIFFSKDLNLEQKGAPNSLNYTLIGFLKAAFKNCSFLMDEIRKNFKSYDNLERSKIIFLMAICNADAIDDSLLTQKERDYQKRIREASFPDPYKSWDRVLGAAQMDMLFGEFMADGTYAPIRRVMDLLSYASEAEFAEKAIAEKKKPEAPSDREKFMLGILNRTAIYSLLRRAHQDPLIADYCIWAILNNDVPANGVAEFKPFFIKDANNSQHQTETPKAAGKKEPEHQNVKTPSIESQ